MKHINRMDKAFPIGIAAGAVIGLAQDGELSDGVIGGAVGAAAGLGVATGMGYHISKNPTLKKKCLML